MSVVDGFQSVGMVGTHIRLAQQPQICFVIWDGNFCASIVRCEVNTTHKLVFILTAVLFQATYYRQR